MQAVANEVVRMEAWRNRRNWGEAAKVAAAGAARHSPWWRRALGWVVWLIWNVIPLVWSFLLSVSVIMSFLKELWNATAPVDKKEVESKEAEKEK